MRDPAEETTSRYRPLFTLARGGMGRIDVVQRREGGFERLYAMKRLHEQLADDHEFVTMFFEEARVAGTIRHSNVVSVLDVGSDATGPYLLMELVEGCSLQQLLQHAAADGLMPLQVGLRILRQVAAGLHAAHETCDSSGAPLALVHRDVSPQNILVGHDGVARITDFGIAKALGASTQTAAGMVKGKIRYMAPEQLTFGVVDRRADLYALGVVAFELIAGRRPFEGTPEEVARAIILGETPDLGEECPELPAELVELCFRMLARDPALRPASAAEVGSVLDGILAEQVARDGVHEVADYMREHFSEQKEEALRRVREAALTSVEPIAPIAPPGRSSGGALRWAAIGLALVALLLGGFVYFRASDGRSHVAETSGTSATPPAAAPPVLHEEETAPEEPTLEDPTGAAERAVGERAENEHEPAPSKSSPMRPRRPDTGRVGAWSWDHGAD